VEHALDAPTRHLFGKMLGGRSDHDRGLGRQACCDFGIGFIEPDPLSARAQGLVARGRLASEVAAGKRFVSLVGLIGLEQIAGELGVEREPADGIAGLGGEPAKELRLVARDLDLRGRQTRPQPSDHLGPGDGHVHGLEAGGGQGEPIDASVERSCAGRLDANAEGTGRPKLRQPRLELVGGRQAPDARLPKVQPREHAAVVAGIGFFGLLEAGQEPRELVTTIDGLEGTEIRSRPPKVIDRFDGELDLVVQRDELLRQLRVVFGFEDALARFALDDAFARGADHARDIAMSREELGRRLEADARNAGDVVGAVTGQRQEVAHLARRHAELLFDLGGVIALAPHGLEHRQVVIDELHEVLVATDQNDLEALPFAAPRQRRDDVIGLDSRDDEPTDPKSVDHLVNGLNLLDEVFGRRGPVRLVVGMNLVSKRRPVGVEDDPEVLRLLLAEHLLEHLRNPVDGIRRLTGRVRQGADRPVRSEDVARTVDEVQTGHPFVLAQGGRRHKHERQATSFPPGLERRLGWSTDRGASAMSEPTPTRFGDYVLLERIGDGGMAEIFLAKRHGYSGFEKVIALKRILPRYSGNETFVRMLIQEAKLAADLQHFNIVQVLDLGDVEGQVYLAMEYVNGRDLAAILSAAYRRKESIPVPIAACIATEFLTGLDYAHRKADERGRPLGIIHRDISPQNILISYEGEVKVTDFGIARFISEKADFQLPGNLHGKFGYMSPEQVGGYEIDQRSDIFSAGVVLWEMLTGRRLFRGKNPKETIDLVVQKPVPPPSELNLDVPEPIDAICLAALERDRASRFQTVGAFLGDLSRASNHLAHRAAPRDVAVYMRRHFGRGLERPGEKPRRVRSTVSADRERQLLGELLRERGVLTSDDLTLGLAEQRARGDRVGRVLIGLGVASEEDVARALADQYGYPFVSPEAALQQPMLPGLPARFPRDAAERTGLLPFEHVEDGCFRVLGHDPTSESALLEARVILGARRLELSVTTMSAVQSLVERWYDPSNTTPATPSVLVADSEPAALDDLVTRLADEEIDVHVASDGRAAKRMIDEHVFVAAILDGSLPRVDGFNLLLAVKARQPDAAVFVTSARADAFRQSKALEMGAEDFLTKPLMVEPVVAKVRRAVRRAQREIVPDWGPESGVAGDLTHMSLVDIVQSLEVGTKSAEIEIQYDDGRSGRLFVHRGQLYRCEPLHGTAAESFFRLVRPGAGRFRIRYGSVEDKPQNLEQPTTFLLMEAMRRFDEYERSSDRRGPANEVDLEDPIDEVSTVVTPNETPR